MSVHDDIKRSAAALRDLGGEMGATIAKRLETRSCGPCKVCCTAKSVYDYEPPKPAWTPCASLCGAGCKIYKAKPQTCTDYLCAWRMGLGGSESRPDRCGVLVDLAPIHEANEDPVLGGRTIIGITVHGNGQPFDPFPVARIIEDASAISIRFVAFANPEDDVVETTLRFDGEHKRISAALVVHSKTGRAPTGWSTRVRPPEEPSK